MTRNFWTGTWLENGDLFLLLRHFSPSNPIQPFFIILFLQFLRQRAQTIIGVSSNLSLFLSVILQPFMPTTSAQIREQCNIPSPMSLPERFTLFLKTGHKHNKVNILVILNFSYTCLIIFYFLSHETKN